MSAAITASTTARLFAVVLAVVTWASAAQAAPPLAPLDQTTRAVPAAHPPEATYRAVSPDLPLNGPGMPPAGSAAEGQRGSIDSDRSAKPIARSARISVVAEPGLAELGRQLAANAERELARIAEDLPDLPVPRAIEIRLVRDASALASVAPADRGAPPWAIGVAYPDLGVISVATRRGAQLVDPQATLRHELAHIALGVALGPRAPHWLHEGFAYQHSGEFSWERTETLAGMAWTGGIIPLAELDHTFPAAEEPAHRAYAESYDFVGFLSRRGRWEDPSDDGDRWPFRRFLHDVGKGAGLDDAARQAFGRSLHQLFDEWRDDLTTRYMLAPVGLLGLLLWVLCALLLAAAWWRRRRSNRRRLAQWDIEERAAHERAVQSTPVIVPPYVRWPGEDPLATDPDDEKQPHDPSEPRWTN